MYTMKLGWPFISIILFLFVSNELSGALPNPEPIIRVDNDAHAGPVFWAEPYLNDSRIATVSHDKTLRIWRARDLKHLQVLRIPIEVEREGKLSYVAASPDGRLLAAGGWTCWDWEEKGCVYLFDAASGALIRRLGGLPNIIGNLSFSPDGKILAVGMHGDGGVSFVDTQSFSVVGQDREYGERVTGLAFSGNGYTVAGALDGYLRIYDAEFKLVARVQIPDIRLIGAAYFSNDNSQLLIGSYDSPSLRILSFPALQVERIVDLSGEPSLTSLRNAIWSRSGEFIYALGDSDDTRQARIYRWSVHDLERYETIEVATHRIQSIRPYGRHGLVFSTEDGGIGLVDDSGKVARISDSALAEFPQMSGAFQVSSDGGMVTIPLDQQGSRLAKFDLNRLSLSVARQQAPVSVSRKPSSTHLQLTDGLNSPSPRLNGKTLELEPFEISRAFDFAPNGNSVFLGTEWSLRAYDRSGALRWRRSMPGVVWNVLASRDGRWVLAALSDGTVRWYQASDGQEVLALFIDSRSREWVLWQPDGYYASSEYGDNLVGWHVNRGMDSPPDFYRAVQFERQFYRPDLLREQINSTKTAGSGVSTSSSILNESSVMTRRSGVSSAQVGDAAKPVLSAFNLSRLNEIAPPRIQMTTMRTVKNKEGFTELELEVSADKNSLPMQDVTVYANLLPVTASRERRLSKDETDRFIRRFRFPIKSGDNLIRVEVNNGVSLGLAEHWLETTARTESLPKGDLYVLAVGVNRFERILDADKKVIPDLDYAVNDAVKLAELLQQSATRSEFNRAHVRVLADSTEIKPTRRNILEALKSFEEAGPNDTVLLFLASHGFSDDTGNYYFLPQDGEIADVKSVLSGKNLTGHASSLLGWTDFLDSMRKASGRRVMIVDTCQAKNIFGEFDSRSLRKRSAAALFPLLLASKGDEFSQEYGAAEHGLFTHALLEGLRGLADANRDRKITVTELYEFAVPLVEKLHNPAGGPQTPQLIAPGALGNITLPVAEQR